MDDKEIIEQFFVNDDPSAKITAIEALDNGMEHYYTVTGVDSTGTFTTEVFVDDGDVFILPT